MTGPEPEARQAMITTAERLSAGSWGAALRFWLLTRHVIPLARSIVLTRAVIAVGLLATGLVALPGGGPLR